MIIFDTPNYVFYFFAIAFYCLDRLKMSRRLNQYARRDSFTGLYNKEFFYSTMEKCIDRGESFHLCVLDIDNFKSINDTYGHMVGDEAILHLADSLRKICPKGTKISRFGGDEFVFAQKNTNREEIAVWLNKLQNLEFQSDNGMLIKFTVSIGVCESSNFTEYREIYEKADECLYISKKAGKGRYTLHSSN